MKIFYLDYSKLTALLLPTFLRNSRIIALLKSATLMVSNLHSFFCLGRADDLFRESIDSTIPRLEFLLNTRFYPEGLTVAYSYRIIIGNLKKTTATNIFLGDVADAAADEGRPQWLGEQWIYTGAEAGEINSDFVIKVPTAVVFDEARMRALVRCYALPGKEFEIIKY
jgi:hypothetical protein